MTKEHLAAELRERCPNLRRIEDDRRVIISAVCCGLCLPDPEDDSDIWGELKRMVSEARNTRHFIQMGRRWRDHTECGWYEPNAMKNIEREV